MFVIDLNTTYGYPRERWGAAKEKLRLALWHAARRKDWLTYSDGVAEIRDFIVFDPHDTAFHHMLGQISVEEDAAGRGMLSALVVHKHGDGQPGPGFYDIAETLGRNTNDKVRCWVEEVNRLFEEASGVQI
jgi:hypothetical protein